MNESKILSAYVAECRFEDLPKDAVTASKKSFLDALGVTLAASGLSPECRPFVDLATEENGKQESTILGFSHKVSASLAAFANGAMAHAMDFEDAHDTAIVHPNAAVMPAALAAAESIGNISGKEFITALAIGCDIVCRLGLALEKDPADFGWYTPPILSAFGATAAVGKLLKLSDMQILDAFSLVLCQATCSAELKYSPKSDIRAVRDAFAAKAGVVSALLAQKGIKGFDAPFEGKAGMYQLYAQGGFSASRLTNELGSRFEGAFVSFKPWPTCRGTHSYIDGIFQILTEQSITPDDIKEIKVIVSTLNKMLVEPTESKKKPVTVIDAKFSIPFVIGTALVHHAVTLDHFTVPALTNQAVLDVANKVSYTVNPDLTLQETTKGHLEIHMKDNRQLSKTVDHAYGSPENPITEQSMVEKFLNCARQSAVKIREENLNKVVDAIFDIEKIKNIKQITQFLYNN